MESIKVGDVVPLRSGGIEMTVTEVRTSLDDPSVLLATCYWSKKTDGSVELDCATLPLAALMKLED
ncbi:DUF2158 domain-containing protein [Humisphaera borealis]|uniref:DUF2158 domain-containing protein n=2 Tax=Humisphaera borealis TaxID=2807512 RepID=A0A7M2WZZ1_9BACT|nr:DUF2158 domain-containing protein [Humisphaera borealis]